jgi:hypothetical protein
VTILIGRYDGRVTITPTETGDAAQASPQEWAAFVHQVKRGQLDYTLRPGVVVPPNPYKGRGVAKAIYVWRWRIDVRRGGRATPWPWTEVVVSRRDARVGAR